MKRRWNGGHMRSPTELLESINAALVAKDFEAFSAHYADDALFVTRGATCKGRAAIADHFRHGLDGLSELAIDVGWTIAGADEIAAECTFSGRHAGADRRLSL